MEWGWLEGRARCYKVALEKLRRWWMCACGVGVKIWEEEWMVVAVRLRRPERGGTRGRERKKKGMK